MPALRARDHFLHYASGHYALCHGWPHTTHIELWKGTEDAAVIAPVDSRYYETHDPRDASFETVEDTS